MSGKYTEEELAGLSETERTALTATDEDDDETLADIAGEDDDDTSDDGADDDNDDSGDADDDQTDDKTDAGADDAADDQADDDSADTEIDPADIPPVTFVPKLSGEILPEFQAKIDQVVVAKQPEIDALDLKLDEGEITVAEHRNQLRAIENSIRAESRKLETESQNAEIGGQLWRAEQEAFFKANPTYRQSTNTVLWGTLNQEVLRLAKDPAHQDLTGIQTLVMAKANVEKAFKAMFPGADTTEKGKDGKKIVPPKPSAKRPDGQTLRDVPAADLADVGQDKFAHLDKLSGERLEAAIARMTPEEQNDYLMGAA